MQSSRAHNECASFVFVRDKPKLGSQIPKKKEKDEFGSSSPDKLKSDIKGMVSKKGL